MEQSCEREPESPWCVTCCALLGKSLNISGPPFPLCKVKRQIRWSLPNPRISVLQSTRLLVCYIVLLMTPGRFITDSRVSPLFPHWEQGQTFRLAGPGWWSDPETEKTSVTTELKWTLCLEPPPPRQASPSGAGPQAQQRSWKKGLPPTFRDGIWRMLCCGQISIWRAF